MCAAPLYEWHLLTEISLQALDVRHVLTKTAAIVNAGKRHSMSFGPTMILPNPSGNRGNRKYQMMSMPNGEKIQQRPHTAQGDFYSPENSKKSFFSRDKGRGIKADDPLVALQAMMVLPSPFRNPICNPPNPFFTYYALCPMVGCQKRYHQGK